jgi:AcrR family transcriptional regulator
MAKFAAAPVSTRERIREAAFMLFGRYGFKRTSMEDIASEAGLSRTALYMQFRNKEDIFRDLARGLHEEGLTQAEAALAGDAALTERLRAAVEAKTLKMIEIIRTSPHGSELMDEKNRLCGDLATGSEHRFHEILAAAFRRSDGQREINLAHAGLSAEDAAAIFACAVNGLKGADTTVTAFKKRLASFTQVFVAGLSG